MMGGYVDSVSLTTNQWSSLIFPAGRKITSASVNINGTYCPLIIIPNSSTQDISLCYIDVTASGTPNKWLNANTTYTIKYKYVI